jgi:hypothetical protein
MESGIRVAGRKSEGGRVSSDCTSEEHILVERMVGEKRRVRGWMN